MTGDCQVSEFLGAVCGQLSRQDYFADLPVTVENRGDFGDAMQAKLDAMGISILITEPEFTNNAPAKEKIICGVELVVQVTETPILNREEIGGGTGRRAIDVCIAIARQLHFFQTGLFTRLEFQRIERQNSEPLIYWVIFQNQFTINPETQSK